MEGEEWTVGNEEWWRVVSGEWRVKGGSVKWEMKNGGGWSAEGGEWRVGRKSGD